MNNRNLKNTEGGQEMCNHNYKDINNTLVGIPKLKMVTPMKYCLQCKQCGEILTVSQDNINDIQDFLRTFF